MAQYLPELLGNPALLAQWWQEPHLSLLCALTLGCLTPSTWLFPDLHTCLLTYI